MIGIFSAPFKKALPSPRGSRPTVCRIELAYRESRDYLVSSPWIQVTQHRVRIRSVCPPGCGSSVVCLGVPFRSMVHVHGCPHHCGFVLKSELFWVLCIFLEIGSPGPQVPQVSPAGTWIGIEWRLHSGHSISTPRLRVPGVH